MKYFKISFLLFAIVLLFAECENQTQKTAGCDVNGIWLGNWEADDGSSGTFITDVAQDETYFDGDIKIRFDLPSLENFGVDYSGRIENQEARVLIGVSGVDIVAHGSVTDNSKVSGDFNVASYMSGSFEGQKLPLYSRETIEICRINDVQPWFPCILHVNNNLWIVNISYDETIIIDKKGNILETMEQSFLSSPSAFDGTYFWTFKHDEDVGMDRIIKFDTLGNKLESFTPPFYMIDALAFDENNNLYAADNYNRMIYKLDASLSKIDSTYMDYLFLQSFQFMDGKIIFPELGNNVFVMSGQNEISEAYSLPIEGIRSITSVNNTIWVLAEEYFFQEDSPSMSDCLVYEFQTDE